MTCGNIPVLCIEIFFEQLLQWPGGPASSVEEHSLCKKFHLVRPRFESRRTPSLFRARLNSHLRHDPEALKNVGKNLAISIGIGTTVVEHATSGQKGNVAQLNWLYDIIHLDWWMHDVI